MMAEMRMSQCFNSLHSTNMHLYIFIMPLVNLTALSLS